MAGTLEDFCGFCRASLKSGAPLAEVLPLMTGELGRLLENPNFISGAFKPDDDFSKKVLHHDQDTGFYVLAHVHQGPKEGPPHSHGASWAIYGTAKGLTGTNLDVEPRYRFSNKRDRIVEIA